MIEYRKMNLFDAPESSLLISAYSCKGVMGAGIAKEFKLRYEKFWKVYKNICLLPVSENIGTSFIMYHSLNKISLGGLFTSKGYGKFKDSKDEILKNTKSAIIDLIENSIPATDYTSCGEIYSNKFNSGLFGVPWEETENVLKEVLLDYPHIKWTVCEL